VKQHHYAYLAKEQMKRFEAFRKESDKKSELEIRQEFFSRPTEAMVCHAILKSITAWMQVEDDSKE
jgi:hypothetical protein